MSRDPWLIRLSFLLCLKRVRVSLLQPVKLTDFGTKGADLKGIFYLRNVVDADAIVESIGQAKKKSNKVMSAAITSNCATGPSQPARVHNLWLHSWAHAVTAGCTTS